MNKLKPIEQINFEGRFIYDLITAEKFAVKLEEMIKRINEITEILEKEK